MSTATVLTKSQVVDALCSFSPKDAQGVLLDFYKRKTPSPLSYREIQKKMSARIKKRKIPHSVLEEAIQWARSQK